VRGASTRQISQALYISEYTVQDHLSNIFDKVGVRDRRALVKRLYLDAILPKVFWGFSCSSNRVSELAVVPDLCP
jgi:hypothetical protein